MTAAQATANCLRLVPLSPSAAAPGELLAVGALPLRLGVGLGRPLAGPASSTDRPSVLVITKISPVESLVMNNLPRESNARPTGRIQLRGQRDRSGFVIMSMAAVVLLDGSVGWPEEKGITESL